MAKKSSETTKQEILKKIEEILKKNINADAKLVFSKIAKFLEPEDKVKDFPSEGVGYVHIDEKREDEYLQWEEGIKQEWLLTIESIRESIKRGLDNSIS